MAHRPCRYAAVGGRRLVLRRIGALTWVQMSAVIRSLAWSRRSWTTLRVTPASGAAVAQPWRRACSDTLGRGASRWSRLWLRLAALGRT
jgi:hypothetical protein